MTEEKRKAMEEMARKMGHVRREAETGNAAGSGTAGAGTEKRKAARAVVPERWKTAPNKFENQFMMDLMILRNALAVRAAKVRGRLEMVNPDAWRDLRLLISLVGRIQQDLMDTMPASREEYYAALARSGRYHLDIEGPIRQGRMLLITDLKLSALCEKVMQSECVMCLRTGREIEQCPIRDTLLEVAPPSETQEDGAVYRCEYSGAAGQLVNGEEVTL